MTKTEVEAKLTALGTKINSISPYTVLRNDTNLNGIPANKLFEAFISREKITECNAPIDGCFFVYTYSNNSTGWSDLTTQFAIRHCSEIIYVRRRMEGTWKPWKAINASDINNLTSDKPIIEGPGATGPGTTTDPGATEEPGETGCPGATEEPGEM